MDQWIPVIIAVLSTASALLSYYGKKKHAGAVDILVSAIEKGDKEGTVKNLVASLSYLKSNGTRKAINSAILKIGRLN